MAAVDFVGGFRTGAAGLLALVVSSACHASLPGPAACDASTVCATEHVCIVGRCRPPGTIPVATLARRVTLTPSSLAVVGPGATDPAGSDAQAFAVGTELGETRVLLDWPVVERIGKRPEAVQRALVVFEGEATADARPGRILVEVSAITERWEPRNAARPTPPRTGLPMRLGSFTAGAASAVVLDITELVRDWLRGKGPHGVAVSMSAEGTVHASYRLERGGRPSPRLEVYLAPEGHGHGPEPRPVAPPGTADGPNAEPSTKDRAAPGEDDEEVFE